MAELAAPGGGRFAQLTVALAITTGIAAVLAGLLRPESGLFFANADALRDAVRAHALRDGVWAVVLDAETIPYVDVTAARMLVHRRRAAGGPAAGVVVDG